MTGRHTRRWFAAIPITGRFYIMFAILLLCGGRRAVAGACTPCSCSPRPARTWRASPPCSARSIARSRCTPASRTELQSAARRRAAARQNLLNALRAQLDLTWALPATAEVAAITDSLRHAGGALFRERRSLRAQGGDAAARPPGHSPISSRAAPRSKPRLRDAMTRMRGCCSASRRACSPKRTRRRP